MGQPFFHYLDTVGDGTGTKNFNGDYRDPEGSGPETALWVADKRCEIARMLISIEDTAGAQVQGYGDAGALANGIQVKLYDENDNEVIDLTDGLPIQTNGDWGSLCYDVQRADWGSGNDMVLVRWTFEKSGKPLQLQPGWYIQVELGADKLDVLIGHYFMIQGHY